LKLQKQVDFLEKNKDYITCIHNSSNVTMDAKQSIKQFSNVNIEQDYSLHNLLQRNITNTCTLLFRNIVTTLPKCFQQYSMGDWPLQIYLAQYGKIKYLSDCMAVYRIHPNGIWSHKHSIYKMENTVSMLKGINKYLSYKYENELNKTMGRLMWQLSHEYIMHGDTQKATNYFKKANKYIKLNKIEILKFNIKLKYSKTYAMLMTIKRKLNGK